MTDRDKLAIDFTLKLKKAIANQDEFAVSILLTRIANAGFKVVDESKVEEMEQLQQ